MLNLVPLKFCSVLLLLIVTIFWVGGGGHQQKLLSLDEYVDFWDPKSVWFVGRGFGVSGFVLRVSLEA